MRRYAKAAPLGAHRMVTTWRGAQPIVDGAEDYPEFLR
jgi:hypothetical protein